MILDTFLLREHPESLEHHCLGRVWSLFIEMTMNVRCIFITWK